MTKRKHLQTERVVGPHGEDVRVMFYDDGAIRFMIMRGAPRQLFEAYLTGKEKDVILSVSPTSN